MKLLSTLLIIILGGFSAFAQNFTDSLRAFPGAEGYGAYVTGGRGGKVFYVTHTDDVTNKSAAKYKTSFRGALEEGGDEPRVVVFMCGGVINLEQVIKCPRSNITIAGQTALGDGICIKGYGVKFSGNNIIVRHMRFRVGNELVQNDPALTFSNGVEAIFDHCSFSWSTEEVVNIDDISSVTLQWCINSESLYDAGHHKGARGYAATIGGTYASYHHNLLAHHQSRMPRQNTNKLPITTIFDYRNNVHYNWGSDGAFYGGEIEAEGGMTHTNMVNNYYIPGPATPASKSKQYFCAPSGGRTHVVGEGNEYAYGHGQWWLNGNIMEGDEAKTIDNFKGLKTDQGTKHNASSEFIIPTSYSTNTTNTNIALDEVLANAGATLPKRDSIDWRIVNEVEKRTASFGGIRGSRLGIIDSQDDLMPDGKTASTWNSWYNHYRTITLKTALRGGVNVDTFLVERFVNRDKPVKIPISTDTVKMRRVVDTDGDGMPDWWEKLNGLNPSDASDGNQRSSSGYTMLEVYLNGFPHANAPEDNTDEDDGGGETSVSREAQPHLRIYPNPVSNYFHLETVLEPVQVDIYSLSGVRAATHRAVGQRTFSVTPLPRGTYFVKVTFENGKTAVQRIVK